MHNNLYKGSRRQIADRLLIVNHRLGERSFFVNSPSPWNSLPDSVQDAASVDVFKTRLKTYPFVLSYTLQPVMTFYMLNRPCFRHRPYIRCSVNGQYNNNNIIIIIIIICLLVCFCLFFVCFFVSPTITKPI